MGDCRQFCVRSFKSFLREFYENSGCLRSIIYTLGTPALLTSLKVNWYWQNCFFFRTSTKNNFSKRLSLGRLASEGIGVPIKRKSKNEVNFHLGMERVLVCNGSTPLPEYSILTWNLCVVWSRRESREIELRVGFASGNWGEKTWAEYMPRTARGDWQRQAWLANSSRLWATIGTIASAWSQ